MLLYQIFIFNKINKVEFEVHLNSYSGLTRRTPWSRVFLQKLVVSQLVRQEILCLL
jgi:hypothetical protein